MELLLTIVKNVEVAKMAIYIAGVIVNGAMANVSLGVSFRYHLRIFQQLPHQTIAYLNDHTRAIITRSM